MLETFGHCQSMWNMKTMRQYAVLEWEVKAIKGERYKKGKKEYLIKWRGYPEDESTWEPIEHLDNAKDLLLQYIASKPDSHAKPVETTSRRRSAPKVRSHFNAQSDQLTVLFGNGGSFSEAGASGASVETRIN